MPSNAQTAAACGDFHNNYLVDGNSLIGTTTTGYINTYGTAINFNSNLNNWIYETPKDGDIKIDGQTFKAKIYCSESKKWIECNIEKISTVDGRQELEVTYDISVREEKARRADRKVLFEKYRAPKPIDINLGYIHIYNDILQNFRVQFPQNYIVGGGGGDGTITIPATFSL